MPHQRGLLFVFNKMRTVLRLHETGSNLLKYSCELDIALRWQLHKTACCTKPFFRIVTTHVRHRRASADQGFYGATENASIL